MPKIVRPSFQLPRRGHWNADDAARVLAEIEAAGTSIEAFAKEHRLRPARLHVWRRRLSEPGSRAVDFHEVALAPQVTPTFEVLLPGGLVARFGVDAAVERVAAIVRALEAVRLC